MSTTAHREIISSLKNDISLFIRKYDITVRREQYKTLRAKTFPGKIIKIPPIKCINSAYYVLHEIGHCKFNHTQVSGKPIYQKEYEAEAFALCCLQKRNIHNLYPKIYDKITEKAISYIMYYIQREKNASRLNKKHITKEVFEFCKLDLYLSRL